MTQKRAKAGGEIGPNGQEYKGGAFIATTTSPKGQKDKKARTGRQEIAPGVWEVAPRSDLRSIFAIGLPDYIAGHCDLGNLYGGDAHRLVASYAGGARWVSPEGEVVWPAGAFGLGAFAGLGSEYTAHEAAAILRAG